MSKDKRRLNKVSWMRNRLGEFFVFGQVGSGKNTTIMSLAHRRTQPKIVAAYRKYMKYKGKLYSDVPKDKEPGFVTARTFHLKRG